MTYHKQSFLSLLIICFCLLLVLPFCVEYQKKKRQEKNDQTVVAYVNKEPVYESDLQRNLDLQSRLDPDFTVNPETRKDQLDSLIDRKLIIQEALDRGLAREDKFVDTIKTFWEQTLIREFIDYKNREFQKDYKVTPEDIEDYYAKLRKKVTFKVFKSRNKKIIDNIYSDIKNKSEGKKLLWETIGPVGYEDITSDVLLSSFDQLVGEVEIRKDGDNYFLVTVEAVTEVTPQPLEEIKSRIEKRIAEAKECHCFDDWLAKKREQSAIKILK